jgi:hypothetical protein
MSEMINYIGGDELVFNKEQGITSGGFSVNSAMLKSGLSPILTVNQPLQSGGSAQVSDLFNDLVMPNWALSYNMSGGEYKEEDSDSDEISEDLHDTLLELVKEDNIKRKKKKTRKYKVSGKKTTRRNKK